MKKFLVLFALFLVGANASAQSVDWFKATSFAYKLTGEPWSNWINSSVRIKIDYDQDKITILSEDVQIYKILSVVSAPYDNNGKQVRFRVIDQDGDYGYVRFRLVNDSYENQIYVDFTDISWVYNVISL